MAIIPLHHVRNLLSAKLVFTFAMLAFGLCAALLQESPFADEVVGIGQLKQNGAQCDVFFRSNSTSGDPFSLNGHAVAIQCQTSRGASQITPVNAAISVFLTQLVQS
jgi:hypothetical protein